MQMLFRLFLDNPFLYKLRRIATYDSPWFNIFHNNATGGADSPFTYGNALPNKSFGTYPCTGLYAYGSLCLMMMRICDVMPCCTEKDSLTDRRILTYVNGCSVITIHAVCYASIVIHLQQPRLKHCS